MMHARIMAVRGPAVDRRTKDVHNARQLDRQVDRALRSLRMPGPYLVERYAEGARITVTIEG